MTNSESDSNAPGARQQTGSDFASATQATAALTPTNNRTTGDLRCCQAFDPYTSYVVCFADCHDRQGLAAVREHGRHPMQCGGHSEHLGPSVRVLGDLRAGVSHYRQYGSRAHAAETAEDKQAAERFGPRPSTGNMTLGRLRKADHSAAERAITMNGPSCGELKQGPTQCLRGRGPASETLP